MEKFKTWREYYSERLKAEPDAKNIKKWRSEWEKAEIEKLTKGGKSDNQLSRA